MEKPSTHPSRRRFLKLTGTGLALIPLVQVAGCSESAPPPPAPEAPAAPAAPAAAMPEPEVPAAAPVEPPATPPPAATDLTRLDENGATAKALGYRHDAAEIDAGAFPRFQQGQMCSNCQLYVAGASSDPAWGGCSIFPTNAVSGNGWCSAYVAKS